MDTKILYWRKKEEVVKIDFYLYAETVTVLQKYFQDD